MSRPLGDSDEFAVQCEIVDRDQSGACRETLGERLDRDEFSLIQFLGDEHPAIVQTDVPSEAVDWVIDAEMAFVPNYRGDRHSVAELVAESLDGTGFRVVSEDAAPRYYIVSEAGDD